MSEPPGDDIDTLLRRAIGLVDTAPSEAAALARQVLAARPGDQNASAVLSSTLRTQGDLAGAEAVIAPIAAAYPDAWAVQFEWARTLAALGRSRDAVPALEHATRLNPRLAPAWRLLGDIRLIAGEVGAAQTAYDHMLAAILPDERLRPSAAAFVEGRPDEAEAALRAILARDPDALAAVHLMAEVLARRGLTPPAEQLLEHCLQRAPQLTLARQAYALALQRNGKPREALAQLDILLSRDPGDVRTRAARAGVLTELGDHAGVAEITAALCEAFPDQPHGWVIRGAGLRTLGRIDEAVAAWRKALTLAPDRGDAYWSLADLKSFRFSQGERAAMADQLARADLGPENRGLIAFALGKSLEDEGRFAEAFERYAAANAAERARRRYDPEAAAHLVDRAKAMFTPAFFEARAGWGDASAAPIFIVGLPRSGSTLVEQILASHPDVEGTGELMDIQAMADWAAALPPDDGAVGYLDRIAQLTRQEIRQLGADYIARTAPRRRLGRAHFIDKAPWNFLHTGLIQLILPNAKIVDVRRHPLGCCLSAFKQHFSQGSDFSYDLTDLGRYYADYVDLMAHFDRVLPGRVHRVIYERLVADTEAEVRRLLDDLALRFDAACLRFFENPRAVATPSSEQVRQPIFTGGVDQWRNFEPWLDPLKAALGPVLETYPDAP